jgi:hypothetical protein
MITEMDVLDDGLRRDIASRDAGVADIYARLADRCRSTRTSGPSRPTTRSSW